MQHNLGESSVTYLSICKSVFSLFLHVLTTTFLMMTWTSMPPVVWQSLDRSSPFINQLTEESQQHPETLLGKSEKFGVIFSKWTFLDYFPATFQQKGPIATLKVLQIDSPDFHNGYISSTNPQAAPKVV